MVDPWHSSVVDSLQVDSVDREETTVPGPIDVAAFTTATPQQVWNVMTDLDGARDTISGIDSIERLDDLPGFQVGTRWRETRTMFGRSATETMEVIACDPGRSYATEAHNRGTRYVTTMSVTPVDGGQSMVSMRFEAEVTGVLNKTIGALVGRLMMGNVRKAMQADVDDIARAAEHSAEAG